MVGGPRLFVSIRDWESNPHQLDSEEDQKIDREGKQYSAHCIGYPPDFCPVNLETYIRTSRGLLARNLFEEHEKGKVLLSYGNKGWVKPYNFPQR